MIDTRTSPYAALLLRISLGGLFLAHAALKLFVFTPAGTAQFFASVGVPGALAYVTIAAETLGLPYENVDLRNYYPYGNPSFPG